jgi:hypothetical protein
MEPSSSTGHSDQSNLSNQSVAQSMLIGSLGFSIVSIAGFSVWAFGERWLHEELTLFTSCAAVFLGLSGLLLFRLVISPNRLWRFYKIFLPAFLLYAVAWSAAWWLLKFGLGEWLGSLLGSIMFAAVVAWGFGSHRSFVRACAVLFICHSAGYFLGAQFMQSIGHALNALGLSKPATALLGMLGWGAIYGAGFGAGIGYTFHIFQSGTDASVTPDLRDPPK